MSRVFVMCLDGPLAGKSFEVDRCPKLVRCVRSTSGQADILNLPEDEPRADEEVFWYRWNGEAAGHLCMRGQGCMATVSLEYAPGVRDLGDGRRERQLPLKIDDIDQVEGAARQRTLELAIGHG